MLVHSTDLDSEGDISVEDKILGTFWTILLRKYLLYTKREVMSNGKADLAPSRDISKPGHVLTRLGRDADPDREPLIMAAFNITNHTLPWRAAKTFPASP